MKSKSLLRVFFFLSVFYLNACLFVPIEVNTHIQISGNNYTIHSEGWGYSGFNKMPLEQSPFYLEMKELIKKGFADSIHLDSLGRFEFKCKSAQSGKLCLFDKIKYLGHNQWHYEYTQKGPLNEIYCQGYQLLTASNMYSLLNPSQSKPIKSSSYYVQLNQVPLFFPFDIGVWKRLNMVYKCQNINSGPRVVGLNQCQSDSCTQFKKEVEDYKKICKTIVKGEFQPKYKTYLNIDRSLMDNNLEKKGWHFFKEWKMTYDYEYTWEPQAKYWGVKDGMGFEFPMMNPYIQLSAKNFVDPPSVEELGSLCKERPADQFIEKFRRMFPK